MSQGSHDAGEQVEKQVFDVAQPVLDVIPEYPQEHHVPGKVHEPAVHEHGGKYGYPSGDGRLNAPGDSPGGECGVMLAPDQLFRDESLSQEKYPGLNTTPTTQKPHTTQGQLIEENQGAQADENYIDVGESAVVDISVGVGKQKLPASGSVRVRQWAVQKGRERPGGAQDSRSAQAWTITAAAVFASILSMFNTM